MHTGSMLRMRWFILNYLSTKVIHQTIRVLDVGSYDVNGSYKRLFVDPAFQYYGLDLTTGPNVDIVVKSPYKWSEIADDTFDVVISGQAFEHIEFPWLTMAEMVRVLKKGGLLCVVAPSEYGLHRHPVDCYRFYSDGLVALARYVNLEVLHVDTNCLPVDEFRYAGEWCGGKNKDTLLVARKPYGGKSKLIDPSKYKCVVPDLIKLRGHMTPSTMKFLQFSNKVAPVT